MLFAAPPVKDLEWSSQGVEGCSRFLKRVWRIFEDFEEEIKTTKSIPEGYEADAKELRELRRMTHVTIRRVTEDIQIRMQFNTAIAAIMELVNHLYSFRDEWAVLKEKSEEARSVLREAFDALILLLSPFAPHIAEEMWSRLGCEMSLGLVSWPVFNEALMQTEEMLIVVQVNGKVRHRIMVPTSADEEAVKARVLGDPKIREQMKDKEMRKIIVVPGKLVNIVAK
jgi:leucyl-tRNA synthetase